MGSDFRGATRDTDVEAHRVGLQLTLVTQGLYGLLQKACKGYC